VARFITKPAISPDMETGWDPRPYLWYGQQPGLQSFHVASPPIYIISQVPSVDVTIRTVRTSD